MKIILLCLSFILASFCNAQPFTKAYIMSFHLCDAACVNFQDHRTRLAESDDGTSWTEVPNFVPYQGSVPDVVTRGSTLYLYNPGQVKRYDNQTNTWDVNPVNVSITDSAGGNVNFVDPSAFVDSNDSLVLFFLNSTGLTGDPAGCPTYPCTKYFDSAVEVAGSNGTQFRKQDGHRLAITLTTNPSSASDPDVFFDGTKYILYVSQGSSTNAYQSATLHGTYSAFPALPNAQLTNQGGIPCGHYDSNSTKYWTYVHANSGGNTVIKQAIHSDFSAQPPTFTTVISGPVFGMPASSKTESPGFCVNGLLSSGKRELFSQNQNISVYPNPLLTDTKLNVRYSNDEHQIISFIDIAGRLIIQLPLKQAESSIEPGTFKPGVYFYSIKSKNNPAIKGKLVVI